MSLRRFWNSLRSNGGSDAPPEFSDEEAVLHDEMTALDKAKPEWDQDARLVSAVAALKIGMSPAIVAAVYGDDLTKQATELIGAPLPRPRDLRKAAG